MTCIEYPPIQILSILKKKKVIPRKKEKEKENGVWLVDIVWSLSCSSLKINNNNNNNNKKEEKEKEKEEVYWLVGLATGLALAVNERSFNTLHLTSSLSPIIKRHVGESNLLPAPFIVFGNWHAHVSSFRFSGFLYPMFFIFLILFSFFQPN